MPELTDETKAESAQRIRRHQANAAPYPHPPKKPDGKGPTGWRRKSPADETMRHGFNKWVATVSGDAYAPGCYTARLVKYFDDRSEAIRAIPDDWYALVMPYKLEHRTQYRLTMSKVFDDCDEAMAIADEVMR